MVVSTRAMAALTEELKLYFENLVAPLVKQNDLKSMEMRIRTEILGKVEEQNVKLEALQRTVNQLTTRVETLETAMVNKDESIVTLSNKCDNLVTNTKLLIDKTGSLESYSRRPCLRITGVEANKDESNADVINIVKECLNEINADIPITRIDRIHRIGKREYNRWSEKFEQQIIVKFKDWEDRCLVYKSRPKWHELNKEDNTIEKPSRRFSVKLDLSKERNELLNYAIKIINDQRDGNINYIFADINCNLVCKLNNGLFKYFKNKVEFHNIVNW